MMQTPTPKPLSHRLPLRFGGQKTWFSSSSMTVVLVLAIALFMMFPIFSLITIAFSGTGESLAHILEFVLLRTTMTTLLLLCGVAVLTAMVGTVSAWIVSFYDFPGRKWFTWALVLPLAVPTYIASYAIVEFFSFTGPVQEAIRMLGGYSGIKDYWSPDLRTLGGAIFVLSAVLYPYTYLTVLGLFRLQGGNYVSAARLLQASQFSIFLRILLPLARPAVIVGTTLALMECLNDVGAVEYLGVETLTFAIFSTWLNRGDMSGAAQITLVLFCVVVALVTIERHARRHKVFHDASKSGAQRINRQRLEHPFWRCAAITAVSVPIGFGFGIPFYMFLMSSLTLLNRPFNPDLLEAASTSFLYGLMASILTVVIAIFLAFAQQQFSNRSIRFFTRFSVLGYAIPGTIIALGLFIPLVTIDNWLNMLAKSWFDVSFGLLITGSGAVIVFAYMTRFMAIAEGNVTSGYQKLSPNLSRSARTLGSGRYANLWKIDIPLLRPAIASAALLVFIDSLKELSATLLLRPFNFNTLSTYVYDLASRARVEEAALASLFIVIIGLVPVYFLNRHFVRSE